MSEAHAPEEAPRQASPSPANPRRSADEDRAWSQLYAAVRQPSTAEEVVKHLNADPATKRSHMALYIHASTTLREQKAVTARNQRIGAFVRLTVITVVFGPFRMLRRIWNAGRDVAVEAMPPVRREPAASRTPALRNDPAFAQATQAFESEAADSSTGQATNQDQSRRAKAA